MLIHGKGCSALKLSFSLVTSDSLSALKDAVQQSQSTDQAMKQVMEYKAVFEPRQPHLLLRAKGCSAAPQSFKTYLLRAYVIQPYRDHRRHRCRAYSLLQRGRVAPIFRHVGGPTLEPSSYPANSPRMTALSAIGLLFQAKDHSATSHSHDAATGCVQ
jgi:hypothetical protein